MTSSPRAAMQQAPDGCKHGIIGACTRCGEERERAEGRAAMEENHRLRMLLCEVLKSLGNGSGASPECSLDFLASIPEEVRLEVAALRASLSSLAAAACWCRSCHADDVAWQMTHFVVCPDCGCKRCPKAESHEAACTGKLVPANTPTGLTHTCSGCEENRARLNDAVQSASAPRGAAGEASVADQLADALRDVLAAVRGSNRLPETTMQAERALDAIRAARVKADAALAAHASAPRGAAGEGGEQTVPDDGEVWEQVARDIATNPRPIEEIKRDVAKVRERIDRAAGLRGDEAQEGGSDGR